MIIIKDSWELECLLWSSGKISENSFTNSVKAFPQEKILEFFFHNRKFWKLWYWNKFTVLPIIPLCELCLYHCIHILGFINGTSFYCAFILQKDADISDQTVEMERLHHQIENLTKQVTQGIVHENTNSRGSYV